MSGLLLVAAFAQAVTTAGSMPAPATDTSNSPAPKHVGTLTYVDAEAGLGYSTNPFLSVDDSSGQGFGRFSLRLVHTRITDRTTTVLSAYAQDVTYTGRYGSQQSFDVSARHDARVNEKLELYIDGDAAYDRGGQLDTRILGLPDVPLLPGTIAPPQLLLPGSDFLSVAGRSYRADANVGGELALSEHGFLDFSAGVAHDVFKSGALQTRYTTIPLSVGYDQELSARTSVGARIDGQFTYYAETSTSAAHKFRVITPELTARFKIAENITLSGDVGASFTSFQGGTLTRNSIGFAGEAKLCSSGEKTQLCATASLQQQAPTSVGPARVLTLGVDYTRQLTTDDQIQFSLADQQFSNPVLLVSGETFTHATYIRAAADYSRHLGHRWFGGISVAARKITQNGPDPRADLSASIFVRYRFGDLK